MSDLKATKAAIRPTAPHGSSRPMARRLLLGLPFALAACESRPPARTNYPPFDFSYLTRLRLNVATIDIDNSWHAAPDPREVGAYAPIPPATALHQMALDRLGAGGGSGRAVFTILDASLLRFSSRVEGVFAVRLSATSGDATRSAYAEARVSRSLSLDDDDPATLREALYTLVKQAMDDMNVEFEYQVRRSLHDWLQTTSTTAPLPPPVRTQDLPPPPNGAPASLAPPPPPAGMSPPPGTLRPPAMPRMADPNEQPE
jgi:hypothetical protein